MLNQNGQRVITNESLIGVQERNFYRTNMSSKKLIQEIVVEEVDQSKHHYMQTEECQKPATSGYYQSRMKLMEMSSKLNRLHGYHSCGSG